MERAFREREQRRAPARRTLPRIEREVHTPIATLSTSSSHMRLRLESVEESPHSADLLCRIVGNVQAVLPEGSTPLPQRLLRTLAESR